MDQIISLIISFIYQISIQQDLKILLICFYYNKDSSNQNKIIYKFLIIIYYWLHDFEKLKEVKHLMVLLQRMTIKEFGKYLHIFIAYYQIYKEFIYFILLCFYNSFMIFIAYFLRFYLFWLNPMKVIILLLFFRNFKIIIFILIIYFLFVPLAFIIAILSITKIIIYLTFSRKL